MHLTVRRIFRITLDALLRSIGWHIGKNIVGRW